MISIFSFSAEFSNLDTHLKIDDSSGVLEISGTFELSNDAKLFANTIIVRKDAHIFTNGFNVTLIARKIIFENAENSLSIKPDKLTGAIVENLFDYKKEIWAKKLKEHELRKNTAHFIVDSQAAKYEAEKHLSVIKIITLKLEGIPLLVTRQEKEGMKHFMDYSAFRKSPAAKSFDYDLNTKLLNTQATTLYIETPHIERDYDKTEDFLSDEVFLKPGLTLSVFKNYVDDYLALQELIFLNETIQWLSSKEISPDKETKLQDFLSEIYPTQRRSAYLVIEGYFTKCVLRITQQLENSKFRKFISEDLRNFVYEKSHPSDLIVASDVVKANSISDDDFAEHLEVLKDLKKVLELTIKNIEREYDSLLLKYHDYIDEKMNLLSHAKDLNFSRALLPKKFYDRKELKDYRIDESFSIQSDFFEFVRLLRLNRSENKTLVAHAGMELVNQLIMYEITEGRSIEKLRAKEFSPGLKFFAPVKPEIKWNELK
ncbi:MAG: hypothetical protein KA116_04400 [Proteobacteria bacterium]|nr:hypothetical protein [Pseudomonadota bacterium]